MWSRQGYHTNLYASIVRRIFHVVAYTYDGNLRSLAVHSGLRALSKSQPKSAKVDLFENKK